MEDGRKETSHKYFPGSEHTRVWDETEMVEKYKFVNRRHGFSKESVKSGGKIGEIFQSLIFLPPTLPDLGL